ncbi:CLUMA_CG003537, isoform A [Clunio marinus]|uniref:CLUMA_CG003537, isoform A n=1 Tax=Clunio marinus TaxID=568069 RepID=A0A1J1HNW0_9DIPT|nr:CLUMA_CG003537, isoform A [Clunio marinus]
MSTEFFLPFDTSYLLLSLGDSHRKLNIFEQDVIYLLEKKDIKIIKTVNSYSSTAICKSDISFVSRQYDGRINTDKWFTDIQQTLLQACNSPILLILAMKPVINNSTKSHKMMKCRLPIWQQSKKKTQQFSADDGKSL